MSAKHDTSQRGSALAVAVLILGVLSVLGTMLMMSSVTERHAAGHYGNAVQALGVAETGLAFGKRMIQDMAVTMGDCDSDGRPDFSATDTMSWGGIYTLVAEASEPAGLGIAAYRSDRFTLVCEGVYRGAVRRVRTVLAHDSFLKYARFVAEAGVSYGCGAVLTGEVHCGGDLLLASGCGADVIQFLEFVSVVGDVRYPSYAIFHHGYVTDADPIDLANSVDFNELRKQSKGSAAACDCEGIGHVGIYIDLVGGVDPLSIAGGPLDFGLFDFYDTSLSPGDTIITYASVPVPNTKDGGSLRASDFNGIIFFEDDAPVQGTLDGRTGRSVSVFALDNVIVCGDIVTGHTGFDAATGKPNGSGNPVNVGLVSCNDVFLDRNTPRVLRIDAALMSCQASWRAMACAIADHPMAGPGPLDLDLDGILGETPYNNDPQPGMGWDELNITEDTWVLNISGPIITSVGGSAWPWNDGSVLSKADGPTRRYNYDMDITEFPPPCFPVPLNLWRDIAWSEIFETDYELTEYLPD